MELCRDILWEFVNKILRDEQKPNGIPAIYLSFFIDVSRLTHRNKSKTEKTSGNGSNPESIPIWLNNNTRKETIPKYAVTG